MKTKKNSVRRSLILSATALMISVAMLIGTTFAWFTDSVSSDPNKIVAGNLDITVSYLKRERGGDYWEKLGGAKDIFVTASADSEKGQWEPGHTEIACLRVENTGTLAAAYQAVVKVANATPFVNQNGKTTTLDKYLKYGVLYYEVEKQFENARDNLTRDEFVAQATKPLASFADERQTLMPRVTQYIILIVTMPTDVGNEANAASKDEKGSIDLTVQINGTQDDVEKDSFGQLYDSRAYDDIETEVGTTDVTTDESGTKTVTMAVGVKDEKGYTTATLTGTDTEIAAEGKTAEDLRLVVHKESKPMREAKDSCAYEPLNIVVENKAVDVPVTITRNIGANKRGVKVYRGGEMMLSVSSVEKLTEDNHYYYDEKSGKVTFATKYFDIRNSEVNPSRTIDCSKYDIEWTDKVTTDEELAQAIAEGETNIKLATGTFTLPTDLSNQSFTISGNKEATVYVNGQPSGGKDITFEGITVHFKSDGDSGFINTTSLTYISCTIDGKQILYADTVSFTGCTLQQRRIRDLIEEDPDVEADYNVWIYSAKNTTFENCTFDCEGKAVYVSNDGKQDTNKVEFTNCQFAVKAYQGSTAAIEINSENMTKENGPQITIDDFTNTHVTGFVVGSASGSSVWNDVGNKATVIIDGTPVHGTSTTPDTES